MLKKGCRFHLGLIMVDKSVPPVCIKPSATSFNLTDFLSSQSQSFFTPGTRAYMRMSSFPCMHPCICVCFFMCAAHRKGRWAVWFLHKEQEITDASHNSGLMGTDDNVSSFLDVFPKLNLNSSTGLLVCFMAWRLSDFYFFFFFCIFLWLHSMIPPLSSIHI